MHEGDEEPQSVSEDQYDHQSQQLAPGMIHYPKLDPPKSVKGSEFSKRNKNMQHMFVHNSGNNYNISPNNKAFRQNPSPNMLQQAQNLALPQSIPQRQVFRFSNQQQQSHHEALPVPDNSSLEYEQVLSVGVGVADPEDDEVDAEAGVMNADLERHREFEGDGLIGGGRRKPQAASPNLLISAKKEGMSAVSHMSSY